MLEVGAARASADRVLGVDLGSAGRRADAGQGRRRRGSARELPHASFPVLEPDGR